MLVASLRWSASLREPHYPGGRQSATSPATLEFMSHHDIHSWVESRSTDHSAPTSRERSRRRFPAAGSLASDNVSDPDITREARLRSLQPTRNPTCSSTRVGTLAEVRSDGASLHRGLESLFSATFERSTTRPAYSAVKSSREQLRLPSRSSGHSPALGARALVALASRGPGLRHTLRPPRPAPRQRHPRASGAASGPPVRSADRFPGLQTGAVTPRQRACRP